MKCKDCDCAKRGWFKSVPDAYVCIGVKEPFVIGDFPNAECTEYTDKQKQTSLYDGLTKRRGCMKPIIVNIFGGPGAGKSTGAAYVFSQLKMSGINCELVTEYAKDKTWEHNMEALSNQAYVFGKQFYRISRCANQVDVIITDSPLALSVIYNHDPILGETFNKMVLEVFNSYDNLNYMLLRTKPYNPIGRNQTEEESDNISKEIIEMLENNSIDFIYADGDIAGYTAITCDVLNRVKGLTDEHIEKQVCPMS